MCDACSAEYRDPTDRRYHAEPIVSRLRAGTALSHRCDRSGADPDADPLTAALATIRSGGTVAVKGLGGYHLACDATDDAQWSASGSASTVPTSRSPSWWRTSTTLAASPR